MIDGVSDGEHGVGVVFFGGVPVQRNLLIHRPPVRIKIGNDQIRADSEALTIGIPAVTGDDKVVRLKPGDGTEVPAGDYNAAILLHELQ
jgi:hypothetical protein